MTALPKMTPTDPLVGMTQWPWPYGPFLLADADGTRWKLSARDPYRNGMAQLSCEANVEIDGVVYRIIGHQHLRADGTQTSVPSLHFISPQPEKVENPRRVLARARALIRKALEGPYAQAACVRAVAIAKLPLSEQMRIDEQTRLALATKEELEREIAELRAWLRPGGREDQIAAQLIAELGAIRINGARKRRQVEEKAAELHARTQFRAERKERVRRCEAQLARLRAANGEERVPATK